jgi:GTP cyclohydrolase I
MDKIVRVNQRAKEQAKEVKEQVKEQSKARPAVGAPVSTAARPSRTEAEAAVRTLIRWAGDDPDREGLIGTPNRVVRAYEEWFAGNFENPQEYLSEPSRRWRNDEIVLLRDIRSTAQDNAPIIGRAAVRLVFPLIRSRDFNCSVSNVYAKRPGSG